MGACVSRENSELTAGEKFEIFKAGTAANYRIVAAKLSAKKD